MERGRRNLKSLFPSYSPSTFSYIHRIIDNLKQIHVYSLEAVKEIEEEEDGDDPDSLHKRPTQARRGKVNDYRR